MRIFKQSDTGTFIQFELGKDMYYLGDCIDLDSIPNPRFGGIDLIQCWNRSRTGFQTLGSKKSAPGNIEVTITDLYSDTGSWLEKMAAKCPFTLYAIQRDCGDANIPNNWIRGSILYNAELIGDELGNVANHLEENEMTKAYSMVAWPPRVDIRRLSSARQVTVAAELAMDIAVLDQSSCGTCTPSMNIGDVAYFTAEADPAASVVYEKWNDGAWTACAAVPFTGDLTHDAIAIEVFPIGTGINRILCGRITKAATPLEVSYSDDRGATWTKVTVGNTVTEGLENANALFALDREHIWLCTGEGEVYFSGDGGESWTSQDAVGPSGGLALYGIHFCDESYGVAVGDTDTVIITQDGGEHWTAGAATTGGVDNYAVFVFSPYRWIVGTAVLAAGPLWMTFDGGLTYEHKVFTGMATRRVNAIDFATPGVGMMVVTLPGGPVSQVWETIDGGNSWQMLDTVMSTNVGLNSLDMYDVNGAYVVGNVVATAVILSIGG